MIDTIVMKIKEERVLISEPQYFTPEFRKRAITELSPTELKKDGNRPHLQKFILRKNITFRNRVDVVKIEIYEDLNEAKTDLEYSIRMEFSVPKLLFFNNLQEISAQDRYPVIKALREYLLHIGINITTNTLENGVIKAVHFGKNILLPINMIFREILAELSKTAISQIEDVTKVQHKNGNETLQLFSGVREYAFYDKIGDMLKADNKAIDKNYRPKKHEAHLIELYHLENRECFRFEYRLKNLNTIKSEVNDILGRPFKTNVVFSDLFSEELWKSILLQSWRRFINKPQNRVALVGLANTELDLLVQILTKARSKNGSGHSQNQALASFGLTLAIKNHGVKMIRDEFNKIWSNRCNERLEEKINTALDLLGGLTYSDRIMYIDSKLEIFERITIEILQKEMI